MVEMLVATGSGTDSGVVGGGSAFSFSLSFVFFVFFSAVASSSSFGFFLYSLLFSSALFLSSSSSSRLSRVFFFRSPSPVFIGKNRGDVTVGRPLLAAPSTIDQWIKRRRQVGEMRASYCAKSGKEIRRKVEKKFFFVPCLARLGEEEDGAVQNDTILSFLYFFLYLLFFCGDPKMGYNSCPPLYNAYGTKNFA